MILSKIAKMRMCPANATYWRNKGYKFFLGRKNYGQIINVKVSDLPLKSNIQVLCKCDNCGRKYTIRFSEGIDICYDPCKRKLNMIGNNFGKANKGKHGLSRENHPRWNPNKGKFKIFANRVQWLTELSYRKNKELINPKNLPRTLAGILNGFQLDHIFPVKKAFESGWDPEQCAEIKNLQMLPWKENRTKGFKEIY